MNRTIARRRRAFTLVELLIVLAVIVIMSSMALPNMVVSRQSANEASAIASLRQISSAQETYRARHGGVKYGSLGQLAGTDLLDTQLASGYKNGYTFTHPAEPTAHEYVIEATPVQHGGVRHFRIDASGVIRVADGEAATETSTPIQ